MTILQHIMNISLGFKGQAEAPFYICENKYVPKIFSDTEHNSSRIRVSEQNFEQKKRLLRALLAGGISHFKSRIFSKPSESQEARYVGENASIVTLTSYFMRTKPFPYPFPQNCKRTRTKLVSLAANGSTHIILISTILPQRNLRRFPFNENSGFKFRKFHMPYGTVVSGCTYPTQSTARLVIRELQQRGRRRQGGRQKSNRFIKQNNNFVRASRFFVDFFTVLARLRRENA